VHDDWGNARFPLVPGHEGVGLVKKAGSHVKHLKLGDRVGIGWMRDSCTACEYCLKGEENICLKGYTALMFGAKTNSGCFAKVVRCKAKFTFPIPDSISSEHAAPLLCAGITVYQPLSRMVRVPGVSIGIAGIGGLGHLGLQFARKLGCHVVALSTSDSKEAMAKEFGAHDFINISNEAAIKKAESTLDGLLITSPNDVDWAKYFSLLKPNGRMVVVGIPNTKITIPTIPLVFGQKSLEGSIVGGSSKMMEMLRFCAIHKIVPLVETFPFEKINEAMKYVKENKARFRVVLKH